MLSEYTGKDLLDEIKLKDLKKFNSKQMFACQSEIKIVDQKIDEIKRMAEISEVTEQLSVNFSLLKSYKDHLIRIVNCYKFKRFLKIQEKYFLKEEFKELLSKEELDSFNEFIVAADEYLRDFRHLSLENRNPPLDFYVQILTLEDCGMVMCGDEFVDLKKDRIYFLKKSDVAHLLNKNLIKII